MPDLGGLRHAKHNSVNTGWRNASFRGYADYMQTPEFEKQIEELIQLAKEHRIALTCAEAVPWRCHRSLIGDALTVRGIRAEDIMSLKQRRLHTLTPFAHVRGSTVMYPAENSSRPKKRISTRQEEADAQDTMIAYKTSKDARVLFVGINPHPGSYRRGVPFSNNKMFWYLLNRAGLLQEAEKDLRNDQSLKRIYEAKFLPEYGLNFVNLRGSPHRRCDYVEER